MSQHPSPIGSTCCVEISLLLLQPARPGPWFSLPLGSVGYQEVRKTAGPFSSKTKVWYGLMTSRGSQTLQWSEDVRGCWRSVCWSVGPSFSQTSRPWARWGSRGTRKTALNCLHDRFEEAIWECLLDLRVGCWVREDSPPFSDFNLDKYNTWPHSHRVLTSVSIVFVGTWPKPCWGKQHNWRTALNSPYWFSNESCGAPSRCPPPTATQLLPETAFSITAGLQAHTHAYEPLGHIADVDRAMAGAMRILPLPLHKHRRSRWPEPRPLLARHRSHLTEPGWVTKPTDISENTINPWQHSLTNTSTRVHKATRPYETESQHPKRPRKPSSCPDLSSRKLCE